MKIAATFLSLVILSSLGCGSSESTPDAGADVTIDAAPPGIDASTRMFRLTVVRGGNGMGMVTSVPAGIDCGLTCTIMVLEGSSIDLNAVAGTNSIISAWNGGGCTGSDPSCTVVVTADTTVNIAFALNKFPLDVTVTGDGTVTSSPTGIDCGSDCTEEFTLGTMVTLTATPTNGMVFSGWTGGGCTGVDPCVVTVSAATAVAALFECPTGTTTLGYTGAEQTLVVPACVTSITVDVLGGGGGTAFHNGQVLAGTPGGGGRVQATVAVTGGPTISVFVGRKGADATAAAQGNASFNGGGAAGAYTDGQHGGSGGGASDIRIGGNALTNRIVVAGGGGGVASCSGIGYNGGVGGGLVGGDAPSNTVCGQQWPTGGTQTAGGAGSSYSGYCTAGAGALGVGADGCSPSGAGGGGGGYFGGGGGAWTSGAGGSSYTDPTIVTAVTHTQGVQAGDGSVTISW